MTRVKHYHVMNGSVGCIPDNNEVCYTIESCLDFAKMLFDDIEEHFITSLRINRIHYFSRPQYAGADYVEISDPCFDVECLQ